MVDDNIVINSEQEHFNIGQIEEVKFLNYTDLSSDKASIKRKKSITRQIQKMTLTCLTLLMMFALTIALCSKYSFSKLYYISIVVVGLILILYPTITLSNCSKKRLIYCTKPFKYNKLQNLLIKLSLFLTSLIVIVAYNLTIVDSVKTIFTTSNFANFLCPIMLSIVFIIDFAYGSLFYKKYRISK